MSTIERSVQSLSDDELLVALSDVLRRARRSEACLVAHLAEVDARRLYARAACPSMYAYCTQVLGLSEPEAYLRIAAARASREHPQLLTMLADGRMHLSGIVVLAPHLTFGNRDSLLERAAHESKRRIEELVAEAAPRPDVRSAMRRLPERSAVRGTGEATDPQLRPDGVAGAEVRPGPNGVDAAASRRPSTVEPLAPGRYKVQFTASAVLREKLERRRLRALMRSAVPDGDLAAIIETAVTEKLERLEARRFGTTARPRTKVAATTQQATSRHIPAAVRRAVCARDGDRCCYTDREGRRCTARNHLEFHHRHPYGYGGGHSVGNLCLMCRAHNRLMAESDYGTNRSPAGARVNRALAGRRFERGGTPQTVLRL